MSDSASPEKHPVEDGDFNPETDFWQSYADCLREVRERKANGGLGYEEKAPAVATEPRQGK